MRIARKDGDAAPIYRRIVDSISGEIRSGALPAGYRLLTVRELAGQCGVSQGTVKHAYDALERLGLIEKTQGRGTFVCDLGKDKPAGKKDQALQAIDDLLDALRELDFSVRDVRIFLDLKLREREQMVRNVRVGAVGCSPEALAVMCRQISALPYADIYEYPLRTLLDAPQLLDPDLDIVVTTLSHCEQVSRKMQPGKEPFRLALAVTTGTALELAKIPPAAKAGILCASSEFSNVVLDACREYCDLETTPEVLLLGDGESTGRFVSRMDLLILPAQYLRFCSRQEEAAIRRHALTSEPILFQYQIERGSLFYLEEMIIKIYKNKEDSV